LVRQIRCQFQQHFTSYFFILKCTIFFRTFCVGERKLANICLYNIGRIYYLFFIFKLSSIQFSLFKLLIFEFLASSFLDFKYPHPVLIILLSPDESFEMFFSVIDVTPDSHSAFNILAHLQRLVQDLQTPVNINKLLIHKFLTRVQRPPMGPKNKNRCWQVVVVQRSLKYLESNTGPQNGDCYRQVIAIQKGLLAQVWLWILFDLNSIHFL